jgi:hypothetical protein
MYHPYHPYHSYCPKRPYSPYRPFRTAIIVAALYFAAIFTASLVFLMPRGVIAYTAGEMAGRTAVPVLIAALFAGLWASYARLEWSALRIGAVLTLFAMVLAAVQFLPVMRVLQHYGVRF